MNTEQKVNLLAFIMLVALFTSLIFLLMELNRATIANDGQIVECQQFLENRAAVDAQPRSEP